MKKFIKSSYLSITLIFIYVPIFILMLFSFNSSNSPSKITGLSFKWYSDFFHNQSFILSITLSLIIGIVVTIISVLIGTMAALGLSKTNKITRSITLSITNIPLINADVVTAVALMLLFISLSFSFGIFTLILAHISFDIPYVIVIIMPRLRKIDNNLIEASTDLGAKPTHTLFKVILPILKPAIITASIIAFTMSFDDFIISYFTGGSSTNVATYIYSLKIVEPYVNAFGTIIILIISFFFLFLNILIVYTKNNAKKTKEIIKDVYKDTYILDLEHKLSDLYYQYNQMIRLDIPVNNVIEKKIKSYELKINREKEYISKIKNKIAKRKIKEEKSYQKSLNSNNKFFFIFKNIWKQTLFISILLSSFLSLLSAYIINSSFDLNIATWGEYIPNSLVQKFEKETGLKVRISLFDSNESLYNKIQTYDKYDIMIPSAYMAVRLKEENHLQKIDYYKLKYENKTSKNTNDFWNNNLDPILNYAMQKTIDKHPQNPHDSFDIRDYQIPYYWGDIRTTYNISKDKSLNNLALINPVLQTDYNDQDWYKFSSDLKWSNFIDYAKIKSNKIIVSDDPKNIFLADSETKLNWVESTSDSEVNDVSSSALNWLKSSNVNLQGDEITNTFDSGNFNFASSYNGDVLTKMLENNNNEAENYLPSYPSSGTNIWEDGMVINKNTSKLNNVYKFFNFMINNQNELTDNNDLVYTSPFITAENHFIDIIKQKYNSNSMLINKYISTYLPLFYNRDPNDPFAKILNNKNQTSNFIDSPGSGLFWYNSSDKLLQLYYSQVIASKTN